MRNISFQTLKTVLLTSAIVFLLLSSVLSINLFVSANRQADRAYVLEQTIFEASAIAETLKSSNGDLSVAAELLRNHKYYDLSESNLILYYDEGMMPAAETKSTYRAVISVESFPVAHAYSIHISEIDGNRELYSLDFQALRGGEQ